MKFTLWLSIVLLSLLPLTAAAVEPIRPNQQDSLVRGAYAEGRLWLLSDAGQLFSVQPDDMKERLEARPGPDPVTDICATAMGLAAITQKATKPDNLTLWRRSNGRWTRSTLIPAGGETSLALICGADGITVLTSKRALIVTAGTVKTTLLHGKLGYGIATAVQTSHAVYVGFNSGEWGGGLDRIDLGTGVISQVSNILGVGCDGLLNPKCDPVNGLTVVPWQPDCIAAAIGLVHFNSTGRIVTICNGHVARLYHRQFGARYPNPSPTADAPYPTVAFFGLTISGGQLLAIGVDGLYRIGADGKATVTPLPAFKKVGPFRVSFAPKDVALILTTANERDSGSGAVPIMVPTPER